MNNDESLALLGGTPLTQKVPPRWPQIKDQDVDAVVSLLRNDHLSAYEVVDGPLFDFESELRERFDISHALLVSSGTAAIQSAIFGLGIGPGDEVIVPSITFPGAASLPMHFGADVRIADVDPETGNLTVENIREVITDRTRAVMLAHAWGLPADLSGILSLLEEHGIALIEDAARAFGSRCMGREVGSIGAVGCFSFHELKAVPAGEGGLLITPDRRVYERAVALGHYFRSKEQTHMALPDLVPFRDSAFGLNLKIHPMAAVLARSQLTRLDDCLNAMAKNHNHLTALLAGHSEFHMQRIPVWAERVSHYGFNLRLNLEDRNLPSVRTLVKALRAEGVKASTAGSPPLFELPLFQRPQDAGLPGRVKGAIQKEDFPGASAHHCSLLRLSTMFSEEPAWMEIYAKALDKIFRNIEMLRKWEDETNIE